MQGPGDNDALAGEIEPFILMAGKQLTHVYAAEALSYHRLYSVTGEPPDEFIFLFVISEGPGKWQLDGYVSRADIFPRRHRIRTTGLIPMGSEPFEFLVRDDV